MSTEIYRPVEAPATDIPLGYLFENEQLEFIQGTVKKSQYVIIVTEAHVYYVKPDETVEVWVPTDLTDIETYSNIAYQLKKIGIDLDNPGNH